MTKINLKNNIWIEGFSDNNSLLEHRQSEKFINKYIKELILIYCGKTIDISEDLAKDCVNNWRIDGLYHNYKINSQYEEYMFKTAKESIQSACSEEYCIIYKVK